MDTIEAKKRLAKAVGPSGLFRLRDVSGIGITGATAVELVANGTLERISRGLYSMRKRTYQHESILELTMRRPGSLICLLSALEMHSMTTQIPKAVWFAIGNKNWKPIISYPPIHVVRFSEDSLRKGVEERIINGVTVRITNPAKTVVDCFKYRNKIGMSVALEALHDGWDQKKITIDEIWRYAKICRVSNVMRPYLESLR